MLYQEIATQLIQLAKNDLAVREQLLSQGKLSEGYNPEMEAVHKSNTQALKTIIKHIGYPTISKVGHEASEAAWLIIQHSIGDPDFMIHCYIVMLENKDDISYENIAYLHDRILMYQSKPQKYGTQMISIDTPYPVENIANLNKYRIEIGLPPLSEAQIKNIPPIQDIETIDNENPIYNEWRKKTGWIK
ncbi:DUF6624 domain-containing protein [Sphingobacterium tabacisoli]|uniref:DUF6624 domain-containing protein n=1 Tax=Sphingobacterium tabacisoli TaxID=2044855 RepID=A0ABW5L2Z0_9SPHI|nr:DUF6624 domain-containing protein [Sphingobacterium tabacisoli]